MTDNENKSLVVDIESKGASQEIHDWVTEKLADEFGDKVEIRHVHTSEKSNQNIQISVSPIEGQSSICAGTLTDILERASSIRDEQLQPLDARIGVDTKADKERNAVISSISAKPTV